MMMSYLKDPDGTTWCIRADGWLYTGDVGVVHPDVGDQGLIEGPDSDRRRERV